MEKGEGTMPDKQWFEKAGVSDLSGMLELMFPHWRKKDLDEPGPVLRGSED